MSVRVALKRKARTLTILDAIDDPQLCRAHFKHPTTCSAWRVVLAALFGLLLSDNQRELLNQCTGRKHPPEGGSTEAWLVCGRRAGKSFILALIAVFIACFKDWR